ncbi:hypothetical protein [Streptomyces sp. NPDC088760]|uniref:hypothetical protein n=1 Tax=Streptomyces sp. NPDC088760 TaxID=3365890 RepID=UPI003825C763
MPIPHAGPRLGPTVADPADDGFVHRCVLTDTEAEQALCLAPRRHGHPVRPDPG